MANIMKQVQKMQQKMQLDFAAAERDMERATVEGSAGNGAVQVVATGAQQIKSIKIAPEAVDPSDIETLEDLVMIAVNDALDKSRDVSSERMNKIAAGLNLPPGLF